MTTAPHSLTPPPPPPPPASHTGRLVGGLLLVLLGGGWLLDIAAIEFPWHVVLPAALIAIGAALLFVAQRGGSHGGLVTSGVIVTVLVLFGSIVDIPFQGGIGERSFGPERIASVEPAYRLGIGQLTVDLSNVEDFASSSTIREISARVGIGRLLVIVPEAARVRIVATAGLGQVQLFDQEDSGFDVERRSSSGGDPDATLTVSVGLGQVEVVRG